MLLGYHVFKWLPMPFEFVATLNPAVAQVYEQALGDASPTWLSLSLDQSLAFTYWLKTSAYLALTILVLILVRSHEQIELMVIVIVVVVFVHALIGLVELYLFPSRGNRANGLFGNANLYAGFVEIGLAFAFGRLLRGSRISSHGIRMRSKLAFLIDWVFSIHAWFVLMTIVMLAALVHSASRSGVLALGAAATVAVVLYGFGERGGSRAKRLVAALLVLGTLSVAWLGAEVLTARLSTPLELDRLYRPVMWSSTVNMVRDYPVFGAGGDTWRDLYSSYKDPGMREYRLPSQAHSDHLQMLAEHGVLGYALFGLTIFAALWVIARGLISKGGSMRLKGVSFGAVAASLSLLLHGLTDSNFHITPTAAYFFVAIGLGLVAAQMLVPSKDRYSTESPQ